MLLVAVAAWAAWAALRPAPPTGGSDPNGSASPTSTASPSQPTNSAGGTTPDVIDSSDADGVKVATFLGGSLRRSYGAGPAPSALRLVWKTRLGSGQTQRKLDNRLVWWAGSGWTGQCTVVRENGRDYLLIGGYDHNLHKIDARTGKVVWEYAFDDVIKSTNTVIENPDPADADDRFLVVAGSRRGWKYRTGDKRITPLRAVSFKTGKELWRLPTPKTDSYSQDVDSSPVMYQGVLYAVVESGYVYAIDPFRTTKVGKHREPVVLKRSPRLYTAADAAAHPDIGEANVAAEASPSRIGDMLYVASGSGHVYGLKLPSLELVWDYKTGTDLDGSTVVGDDGVILQAVEKEYTKLHGGVMALDPSKAAAEAPQWYFPTDDRGIGEWKGGVVGSVAINDESNAKGRHPRLAAFVSVDGSVRVIARDTMTDRTVRAPGAGRRLPVPALVFQDNIGAGISTPVIVGNTLIAAGYDRTVHLYRITYRQAAQSDAGALRSPSGDYWTVKVTERSSFKAGGPFESTPLVWGGRVYLGCRDGFLYCLGNR